MQEELKENLWQITRAVFPVTLLVLILQFTILGLPPEIIGKFLMGAVLVTLGLSLFLVGLKISVLPMGEAIGAELPQIGNIAIILFWAFFLGFTTTLAEPPVRVLASYVEIASGGDLGGMMLIIFTAMGIGLFIALAILRIVLQVPLVYIFGGGYLVILILSFFTSPEYVPVAFDASGATTGPVTVPVILSLGIGVTAVLGGKSTVKESFGLVGIASMGPILALMILGVIMD